MKKAVVTGALGFIGFSLCQKLLEKGISVVGIDGLVEPKCEDIYSEKLLWLGRNSQFQWINKRIEDVQLQPMFQEVDVVYHLAAKTSKYADESDLQTIIEDNVAVTRKIIDACHEKSRLIITSSVQVYGKRAGVITEGTSPNPVTAYSKTKLAVETLVKTKCSERCIPYVIFRLPTIYGPWQRGDMTYAKLLMKKYVKNQNINVEDDRVTEDVLYIDDILEPLIKAGTEENSINSIYNLGTEKADEWFAGKNLIATYPQNDVKLDERMKVIIDSKKAMNDLGFYPQTKLSEGIKRQEEHIKKYKHLYLSDFH